jgi:hypothetical protein
MEYKHSNGEISTVRVEIAGIKTSRICVANLPPEIPEGALRGALSKYGEVKDIINEQWSQNYCYPVLNGIRIAKHVPSHMIVAGTECLFPMMVNL